MLRATAFVVGVCLSGSAVARAESSADQTQTPASAEMQARFDLLVKTGDQARLAGRHNDAATAYKAALDIHPHPVIRGRLGLVLMKLGHADKAAEDLHEAVERGQGVSLQERREVAEAYDKAKALTTWVTVNVSQLGATVTCDGVAWEKGLAAFWRFAMPGEHKLRATLDGYEDAEVAFTAKPGEEITVTLKLVRRPVATPPDPIAPVLDKLPRQKRIFPPPFPTTNVAGDPDYNEKEDPFYEPPKPEKPQEKKGVRFSVHAGVVTVFGVASWNPAVGPVVGVGLRPHEHISFGLEGRAAWLTTGVADRQISAMTAGGIASVCGRVKWFLGCGLGYLGAVNVTPSGNSYEEQTITRNQAGFGGRAGVEFRVGSGFVARGNVDLLNVGRGMQLAVADRLIVDQPPIMFGGQVSGAWEF